MKPKNSVLAAEGDKKDIVGRGIFVHEDSDDFITQPTGNAGGRIKGYNFYYL